MRFPKFDNEIWSREMVFRQDFDDKKWMETPPFYSHAIYNKLSNGEITEEEAIEEWTLLMEEYYGVKYPLDRGVSHTNRNYFLFPRLVAELYPRDTVFRIDFTDKIRKEIPPFVSNQCPMLDRQNAVWDKLFNGEITEEEALEEMTLLMEKYYGFKYSLFRGFNH